MNFHDPDIIDVLERLNSRQYSGRLWRTTWRSRDPLLGGCGGRWGAGKRYEVLYTSLDENTSIAELHYHLSRAPVWTSCDVLICELAATEISVLDLTASKILVELGLNGKLSEAEELARCQEIGGTAYFLQHHGILVPSKRYDGTNCVIFPGMLDPNESLKTVRKIEINWPAWIKNQT